MKIYCGTYAKYANGSIDGAWLDLEDYSDKDEFLAACRELHKDEADPEFMFQDWEGIPDDMVSEFHVSPECWDVLEAYDEFESQQEVTERARREARQQEREARMLALERQGNRTGGGDQ